MDKKILRQEKYFHQGYFNHFSYGIPDGNTGLFCLVSI
jgi:hypothetical protein